MQGGPYIRSLTFTLPMVANSRSSRSKGAAVMLMLLSVVVVVVGVDGVEGCSSSSLMLCPLAPSPFIYSGGEKHGNTPFGFFGSILQAPSHL